MPSDEIKAASVEDPESGVMPDSATTPEKPIDEFDPMGWTIPLICKDCGRDFTKPYRHFQAGVVFHCPHCHGSFVPKMKMHRAVRDAFESFYAKRRRDRDEFERAGGDAASFQRRQEAELQEFHKSLHEIARAMRPAGKMVKPKGIGAMFT
jgi:DNA-directed RNA polymerase subunit RPC12/RpoP